MPASLAALPIDINFSLLFIIARRIETSLAERMALEDSFSRHTRTFYRAELPYRLDGVLAAARHKPALAAQKSSNACLVHSYY